MRTHVFVLLTPIALWVGACAGPEDVAVATSSSSAAAKVSLCHVPPGNPAGVHRIEVGASAVAAHVEQHGDGVCAEGAETCCSTADQHAVCTNLASDPANCGACGVTCASGVCTDGACVEVAECPCNFQIQPWLYFGFIGLYCPATIDGIPGRLSVCYQGAEICVHNLTGSPVSVDPAVCAACRTFPIQIANTNTTAYSCADAP